MLGASGGALRIAVDIGGTFTDLVLEEHGRVVATEKVLTTPDDPADAVVRGVETLLTGRSGASVVEVVHGTTLVSNALIERKGVVTGLLTTEGFRDVAAMGREQRFDLYDLNLEMPQALAARRRRWGVPERVFADGTVDVPLDVDAVRRSCAEMRAEGVEALAICFLHAYRAPDHEERARDVVLDELPDLSVCISSEVAPEVGEYQRVATTLVNAYVLPVVDSYLEALEKRLVETGVAAPVRIMLSNGGLASTETARRFPVRLLESGPAAGVLSAAYHATGADAVLAFDMGGTTAKAALVEHGQPLLTRSHEAARVYRFTRGSGIPIKVPVIDMIEIGAGGGSIARVGLFGLPKVGPDSASSVPGPAAYGLGGTDPTVTDADLVLGYLDAGNFLGGDMRLDLDGARSALAALGEHLEGLDAEATAAAVHRVVNENMASAARMHAIERGRDIRSYTLVATGGAGPVHGWGVARALGVRELVFPPRAGVASAFGMLTAPTAFEFARSLPAPLGSTDWALVEAAIADMVAAGRAQLETTGVPADDIAISADVRYEGQGEGLTVALSGTTVSADAAAELSSRFAEEYETLYGSSMPDVALEIMTWRVRVAGTPPRPDVAAPLGTEASPAPRRRRLWFAEADGFVDGEVHRRADLPPGFTFSGPAVVEERESTIVIGPGGEATVTSSGNIEVRING
jgi:N-methylhydantoinase A